MTSCMAAWTAQVFQPSPRSFQAGTVAAAQLRAPSSCPAHGAVRGDASVMNGA